MNVFTLALLSSQWRVYWNKPLTWMQLNEKIGEYQRKHSCTLEFLKDVERNGTPRFKYKATPRASPAETACLRAARAYDGSKWRFDSDGTGIVYSGKVTPLHASMHASLTNARPCIDACAYAVGLRKCSSL